MRIYLTASLVILLIASPCWARDKDKVYMWTDENGVIHFEDSVPPEAADKQKSILNEHGVTVDTLRGKKTEEEKAEEERLARIEVEKELQRRKDTALLATYMSVDEILMHRDRRIELFQAQTRVTELYLRNLNRRLAKLMAEATGFQPYSDDPEAPMIDRDLSEDIQSTKETIERHEGNLKRFILDEQQMRKDFQIDIERFRRLKGLDQQTVAATPDSNE